MDINFSILSVIFGSIGMGYMVYGKKQYKGVAFLAGIGLCICPYITSDIVYVSLIGILLIIAPFILRI